MVGGAGVRDDADVALRQVAADTVVAWRRGLARSTRRGATSLAMAGEALGLEISRGFRRSGLDVRIVTTNAAQLLLRGEISGGEEALTQAHGVIVLDVILVGRVVSRRWNLEDG